MQTVVAMKGWVCPGVGAGVGCSLGTLDAVSLVGLFHGV